MTKLIGYENNNRIEVKNKDGAEEARLNTYLKPILDALLIAKPLWTFQLLRPNGFDNILHTIEILNDGEVLGYVRRDSREGKYLVGNERIDKQMQRRSYYSTTDTAKALSKIKKTFSSQTPAEILEKARGEAGSALFDTRQSKWHEYTHIKNQVDKAAMAFINGAGRQAFLAYAQANEPQIAEQIVKGDAMHEEHKHMSKVGDAFEKSKAFVVVQKNSVYNVKSGDNIVRYTDADLPEFMRPKLGMLKLIDNRQYITGCGFKVSDSTFVVMNEESKDE